MADFIPFSVWGCVCLNQWNIWPETCDGLSAKVIRIVTVMVFVGVELCFKLSSR